MGEKVSNTLMERLIPESRVCLFYFPLHLQPSSVSEVSDSRSWFRGLVDGGPAGVDLRNDNYLVTPLWLICVILDLVQDTLKEEKPSAVSQSGRRHRR